MKIFILFLFFFSTQVLSATIDFELLKGPWVTTQTNCLFSSNQSIFFPVDGKIMRSVDQGKNWVTLKNPAQHNQCIMFEDAENRIYVFDQVSKRMYISGNNGDHWEYRCTTAFPFHDTFVYEKGTLAVFSNDRIYESSNQGISWSSSRLLSAIHRERYTRTSNGFLYSIHNNKLMQSTKDIGTWKEIQSDLFAQLDLELIYSTSDTLMLISKKGDVLRSTNDGTTWILMDQSPTSDNADEISINNINDVIARFDKKVFTLDRTDYSWTSRIAPRLKYPIIAYSGNKAVTKGFQFYRIHSVTADSIVRMQSFQVPFSWPNVYRIAANKNILAAVTLKNNHIGFSRSSNTGINWYSVSDGLPIKENAHISEINIGNDGLCYMFSSHADTIATHIIHRNNTILKFDKEQIVKSLDYQNDSRLIVTRKQYYQYKNLTDKVSFPFVSFDSLYYFSKWNDRYYAVGYSQKDKRYSIFSSPDINKEWTKIVSLPSEINIDQSYSNSRDIYLFEDKILFATNQSIVEFGKSALKVSEYTLKDIDKASSEIKTFIVSPNGTMFVCTDKGLFYAHNHDFVWKHIDLGNRTINHICINDDAHVYIATNSGIFKSKKKIDAAVSNYAMGNDLLNVYPNPARDIINLSLYSKKELDITLELIHMTNGKVYQEKATCNHGLNKYKLQCTMYPSGVYFVIVRSADFIMIKKISIVK